MNQILEQLGTYGIVPVVVLQDAAKAEPLAEALCKGGLACAEVTFRTDAAEESIRIMSEKFPEMLVGAGTVLTTEQADRAVKAGAKFIVSPGLNPEVVKWCQAHEVPVIPGIVTPCLRSTVHHDEIHADRRHQPAECKRIPGIRPHRSMRRKLDGKKYDD